MRKKGLGGMGLLQDVRGETGMQEDSEEPDSRSSGGSAVNKQEAVGAALETHPRKNVLITKVLFDLSRAELRCCLTARSPHTYCWAALSRKPSGGGNV